MAAQKQTKVLTKRKKFIKVDVPLAKTELELVGNTIEDVKDRTIKLDLTRQLRGKGVEATVKIKIEDDKPIAHPIKIKLMPYFIRRMIRKRISYVEDSFETPSQESMIKIKPFIITRKKVSKAVRRTIRNQAKNWLEDYIKERTDLEIFNEILSNILQKPLSLRLKKTYPLYLCEIRIFEIKRPLKPEEVPKIEKKKIIETQKPAEESEQLDQMAEIEEELKAQKVKEAEEEIKKTQEKAESKEEKVKKETKPKTVKKTTAKKEKKEEPKTK
jgi:ribosomal protein S3AE